MNQLDSSDMEIAGAGFVYFIGAGDFVKIGSARRPEVRLKELQTGCPYHMRPFGWEASPQAALLEAHYHLQFRKHHHRGEWFRIEGALAEFLESLSRRCGLVQLPQEDSPLPMLQFGRWPGESDDHLLLRVGVECEARGYPVTWGGARRHTWTIEFQEPPSPASPAA